MSKDESRLQDDADSRERLEADVLSIVRAAAIWARQKIEHGEGGLFMLDKYDPMIRDLLDRQAEITKKEREFELELLRIDSDHWRRMYNEQAVCNADIERHNAGLEKRIAELEVECNEWKAKAESVVHENPYVGLVRGKQWERTDMSDYYCGRCGWKVTDHDSYCPECGGAFHKTSNKPDSEFDAQETADTNETCDRLKNDLKKQRDEAIVRMAVLLAALERDYGISAHWSESENKWWFEEKITTETSDTVDHPEHYPAGSIEIIEQVIDGLDAKSAYFLGNVLKYVIRAGKKNDDDLDKANNYAHRLCTGRWRWEEGVETYPYVFPDATEMAEDWLSQAHKIKEECDEVMEVVEYMERTGVAFENPLHKMLIEVLDVIHACETLLRLMDQNESPFNHYDIVHFKDKVIKKNRERGYYGKDAEE